VVDLLHRGDDLVGGAAAAPVRLHHDLDALLLAVRGRIGHRLEVVVELRRVVDAEGHDRLQAEEGRVVDLLVKAGGGLFQRDVVAAPERPHDRLHPAGGNRGLQPLEVLGRRIVGDEPVHLRAGEQAGQAVPGGLDTLQRLGERPLGPRAVEAPDGPLRGRGGGQQGGGVAEHGGPCQDDGTVGQEFPAAANHRTCPPLIPSSARWRHPTRRTSSRGSTGSPCARRPPRGGRTRHPRPAACAT